MKWQCRSCGASLLGPDKPSLDTPGHCETCGDLVYAIRPDEGEADNWWGISRQRPEPGTTAYAGSCSGCGLTAFRVDEVSRHELAATCTGQEWDGEWREGCGASHLVRMKPGFEVKWMDTGVPSHPFG